MKSPRRTMIAAAWQPRRVACALVLTTAVVFGAALDGCGSGGKVTVTRTVAVATASATSPTTDTPIASTSAQTVASSSTATSGGAAFCAAQVGEGHSVVEFTARGIECPAGARLIRTVLTELYSRCHLTDGQPMTGPCRVQRFTCTVGSNTGVPSSPGSPVQCTNGSEAVRFVLPG